jgi:hypothetical protein
VRKFAELGIQPRKVIPETSPIDIAPREFKASTEEPET